MLLYTLIGGWRGETRGLQSRKKWGGWRGGGGHSPGPPVFAGNEIDGAPAVALALRNSPVVPVERRGEILVGLMEVLVSWKRKSPKPFV